MSMVRKVLAGLVIVVAATAFAETVTWDFPRTGSCHEGMPFADGVTGVLVWGGGNEINLTVGRADLWDHRGGYPWTVEQSYTNIVAAVRSGDKDRLYGLFKKETPKGEPRNPYMLPLGRVVITLDSDWKLTAGELDTETGIGKLRLSRRQSSWWRRSNAEIEIAMVKCIPCTNVKYRESGLFAMKIPEGLAYDVNVVMAMEQPKVREALGAVGFETPNWSSNLAGNLLVPGEGAVSLSVSPEGGKLHAYEGNLGVRTGRFPEPMVISIPDFDFDEVREASVAHWKKFWSEGARVKVPDPVIQRIFDYGMYRFGAMTDPDGVPAGLQGPWLEDDRLVPWNGDYHFNINVQECYSPAFRGGHLDHLKPLFRMVLGWRPRLRANAKLFCGIDDGYTLPHSVDDRGVCIGGFWTGTIDHGSTAWVAAMMYKYVRYSGDVAFLRDGAYDFMKGAMNVYLKLFEERDGRLSLPMGPSPEWGGASPKGAVGRDPSFQLACAHRLARELVDAATLLKCEAPDPRWLDVERRLPPFTKGRGGIILFEGQPFTESHRHHSHMAGLYPFDTIDLADKAVRRTVYETYETWTAKGTGAWSGWCVPWASILHTHVGNAVAAVEMLRAWDAFYCDEGHGSHHNAVHNGFTTMCWGNDIMQMDGQCAATAAVLELLVHETNGKTNFFRGCPASWKEVSFENVRLSDGRRASGRRLNGEVSITYSGSETQPLARL